MMYYTHFPGGLVASSTYFLLYPPEHLYQWVGGMVMSGVSGLLPDIDHESSLITKKMGLTGKIVSKLCPHRGITHTFFLWAFLFFCLFAILPQGRLFWFCGFLGCSSHILLDAMTTRGVRMFYPFSQKKIRFCKIITGGKLESLVGMVLWLEVVGTSGLLLRNLFFVG